MSGFDPGWLALREPADRRARDTSLMARAGADLARTARPLVCDLGAGTGAARRAFAPRFPADTRWLLVDGDAECLAVAREGAGPDIATRRADLAETPDPWPAETALVTATALFDLAGGAWMAVLAERLARDRLPLLACLTFDGAMAFDPPRDGDAAIREGFLAHQRRDKGLGGPAAGPDAAAVLERCLADRGYEVRTAETPWILSMTADRALIGALVEGIGRAAAETGTVSEAEAEAWIAARCAGLDGLTIGHRDLYAVPGPGLSA